MTHSQIAWVRFIFSRLITLFLDTSVLAIAYFSAFALRLDFQEPRWGWRATACSFVIVWIVQLFSLGVTGVWRRSWRRFKIRDLPYLVLSIVLAAVILTVLRFFAPDEIWAHVRPPYSITLIDAVLSGVGLVSIRFLWRFWCEGRYHEEDVLGREPIVTNKTLVRSLVGGKCVMVTGAGGSIGSEIVRQIIAAGAAKVVMVERSENALYEIMRLTDGDEVKVPEMVDVRDEDRMRSILAEHHPEIVLHAAAYKHVPMVEANPREGIENNTLGTASLVDWCIDAGVKKFVMISTDKAIRPISVMGITKRLAEIVVLSHNFTCVRFGNVFGSSGSVVPLFKEQIRKGGPVTVTDLAMTRYFMTVSEAVSLVLEAAYRAKGGEIFTLDMGEPIRIIDLAERLVEQSGYRPYVDIPIAITGIRPGEKLSENLDLELMMPVEGKSKIRRMQSEAHDASSVLTFAHSLVEGSLSDSEVCKALKEGIKDL